MDYLMKQIDSSGDESYVPEDDNCSQKASDLSDTFNSELEKSVYEESPVCKKSAVSKEELGDSHGQQPDRSDTVLKCSICLCAQSDDTNEVIFCDRCGYSVHEEMKSDGLNEFLKKDNSNVYVCLACYGAEGSYYNDQTEEHLTPSVENETHTELWFCERCVSDDKTPISCELCPNTGNIGLYKGTDNGRWVHLICSMSTPGVSYHDVHKLWPVCLSEMAQNVFGSKVCSLCQDVSLSRTGVCITCDVGLCGVSAHAGCAYLNGLLEFDPDAVTDAYTFCCKSHTSADLIRERIRTIKQCQEFASRVRQSVDSVDQLRNNRFFAMSKTHYNIRSKMFKNETGDEDYWVKPRPLTSSSLVLQMLDKRDERLRELSGQPEECSNMEPANYRDPSFTVNFVDYYNAREQEIAQLQAELEATNKEIENMRTEENLVMDALDEFDELRNRHDAMVICNEHILSAAKKVLNDEFADFSHTNLEHLVTRLSLKTDITLLEQIPVCDVCGSRRQQDSIIRCHNCRKHFHIFCLDPPLKELPQLRSGGVLYGWQCGLCTHNRAAYFVTNGGTTIERSPSEPNRKKMKVSDPSVAVEVVLRRSTRVRKCRKLSL